jgi:WD40 repeat protein
MHRYLALDVAPPDADAAAAPAAEMAPAPRRRVVETPAPRPPATPPARPVVRAGGDAVRSFAVGERIAGAYDVMQVVTTGDLSAAYLAHHRQWDIDLIVKVPNPQLAGTPDLLREWVAGVERWAALGVHPHIASCYSLQWCDGVPLAVTEYVGGDSLRALVAHGRAMDLQSALRLAIEVCTGIEHAHGRGVIHGNLTPDNILLTPQWAPKVANFERALTVGKEAPSALEAPPAGATQFLGSPAYVAPERWGSGYVAQAAADIFGLGVCLYELFFGQPPYASTIGAPRLPAGGETLRTGDPPPDALLGLVRRCVEWVPYRRPASAESLRYELAALHEALFGALDTEFSSPAQQAAEWNTKAVSFYLMGNEADADAAWAAALAADPTCLDACFNRDVAAWRRAVRTDEAVLDGLGAVPVARAERWKLHHLLALVHQERGDLGAALAALEEARRERADGAEVGIALGRLRAAAGDSPAHPPIVGEHHDFVTAVAMSGAQRIAVSASHDGTAMLWDLATGNAVRVFEGHLAPVSSVFIDDAGSLVLTGSDDGTLRLWDTASGVCRRIYDTHAGRIASACLSPDGRWLLWSGIHSSEHVEQMTVQLWDASSGRRVRTFEGLSSAVKSLCLSADGRFAVTGGDDHAVRVWDVETGACLQVFAGHGHYVSAVCISPDNRIIVSGSWDRSVRVWDVEAGQLLRTCEGHTALVTSVALSADAQWAFSGGWDCTARLWAVPTGRCVRTCRGHSGLVTGVALSADGRLAVSGSWDRTLRVWQTAAEQRAAAQLRVAHSGGGAG